jgi:hypothetical protein
MISDKHKFVFIHVPKCGGMSITNHFLNLSEDYPTNTVGRSSDSIMVRRPTDKDHNYFGESYMHATMSELISYYSNAHFNEYYKFATIRNTYDRLISLYFWAVGGNSLNIDRFKHLIGVSGLKGRVGVPYNNGKIKHPRGSAPINFFLCDDNDDLIVDDVFLINNIKNDIGAIYKNMGIVPKPLVRKSNSSQHKHYSEYYTQKMVDIVEEIYAIEIEKFNFKFDNKSKNKIISRYD